MISLDAEWGWAAELLRKVHNMPGGKINLEKHQARWKRDKGWMEAFLGPDMAVDIPVEQPLDENEVLAMFNDFYYNLRYEGSSSYSDFNALIDKARFISAKELLAGKLDNGQKLGRYLAGLIASVQGKEYFNKEWSNFVPRLNSNGFVRISARPLDMLTQSDNTSSWQSCMRLDGDYPGGPMSYLMDSRTLIVFGWVNQNPQGAYNLGHPMPIKTWRVLVSFNEAKDAAWFIREYPGNRDTLLRTARQFIGRGLCKLHAIEPAHWVKLSKSSANSNGVDLDKGDYEGMYPDTGYCASLIAVKPLANTCFTVSHNFPCIVCGDTVDSGLVCYDCRRNGYHDGSNDRDTECYACGEYFNADDEGGTLEDGRQFCQHCWDNHTITCDDCGERMHEDDGYSVFVIRGGHRYEEWRCESCYENTTDCQECGNHYDSDDIVELPNGNYYCQLCLDRLGATECAACGEVNLPADLTYHKPAHAYYCQECYDELIEDEKDDDDEAN